MQVIRLIRNHFDAVVVKLNEDWYKIFHVWFCFTATLFLTRKEVNVHGGGGGRGRGGGGGGDISAGAVLVTKATVNSIFLCRTGNLLSAQNAENLVLFWLLP